MKNNVNAYAETLEKVLDAFYQTPDKITAMKKKAMEKDFSWKEGGMLREYYNLFHYGA